ncbi:septum formation initiator family protein [Pseudobacteriovorax antillogorgiicola]|uniref:Septum formation initiator n=1 Tax=Pseudobacteriovorax antillogorgiicola TaxID=1513793 RepID=A0A1Y6CIN8_9BACT|nr:septum formation initiator family protein [Pseudobacteriovorax antillogorgiicola]TCS46694.1 septum formation initiator [Pseudobacteriovorax antillogorgiicola]SMF66818.1 Septum formation initiator [Pseudobacteriovorax antillogorgiicola]
MPPYRIIILMGALVLTVGMIRGENPISTYWELKDSQQILEETVSGLQHDVRSLEDEIYKIEKSPHYAHKVLRDKYHVTEAGESIVFFAD